MTKENENLREVKEQDTWLVEIKKRSSMVCSSSFELKKLMVKEAVFLPVCIKEELEELEFTYDLTGKRSVEELKKESREKQYQFLINFEKLERVYEEYRISLSVENLYYDENMLPYVKHRDLYSQGEEADLEEYLFLYKSFVGGILGKRYSVEDIQEGGLEILKKDSFFQEYYSLESGAELAEKLREQKELYEKKKRDTKVLVSRKGNLIKNIVAVTATILFLAGMGILVYENRYVIPEQRSIIAANEAYIGGDYVGCIDHLQTVSVENMTLNTKYILALSYAKGENLKREELAGIISKLSLYSNEKELEYWIALGRMEMAEAEDLAQSLSDDKLLMYAYMKELNQLEGDTTMAGEEKQTRMKELESNIKSLGDKYTKEKP